MTYTEFLKTLTEGLDTTAGGSISQNSREMDELIDKVKLPDHFTRNNSTRSRKYKHFWNDWQGAVKHKHENLRYNKPYNGCCFTDIIGRPTKTTRDGKTIETKWMPYQRLLWQILHERKHIWIKKSRGIGLSTYLLYIIAYKCITEWTAGDRVVIITGIRIETAADLIRRLKLLFQKNFPELYNQLTKQKDTVCILNGVIVEAYPAGHVDSVRGIDRCKFILIDEGDHFPPAESKEVRSVVEGFIGKPNSDPTIIFVSTPNRPLGLFQQIEQEHNSIYYKMFLPYQYGLEGETPIYDIETIEEAKKSPDFAKEYEGAYIGTVGNVVSEAAIQNCQRLGTDIDRPINKLSIKAMGIDSAFGGGSNFAITIIEYLSDIQKFRVIQSEEYHRPELQNMLDLVWDLRKQYGNIANIYVDASAPVVWQSLKQMLGELWNESYMKTVIDNCKQFHTPLEKRMVVVPVNFSTEHRKLLQGMKWCVEYTDNEGKPLIAIHPRYEKLITSLRTAVTTTEPYTLNKVETSFPDSLDSFRLATSFIKRKEK